jgi:uncharacterized protein GlcG (DUF336 family)
MATKKTGIPILRVRKGATMKEIYAAAKKAFSAADLQRFTEIEDTVPADLVVEELRAMVEDPFQRRKKKV